MMHIYDRVQGEVDDLAWIRAFELSCRRPDNMGDNKNNRHNKQDNQRSLCHSGGYDSNRTTHQGCPHNRQRDTDKDGHRHRTFSRDESRDRSPMREMENRAATYDYGNFFSWMEGGDRKSRRLNRNSYDLEGIGGNDTFKRKR